VSNYAFEDLFSASLFIMWQTIMLLLIVACLLHKNGFECWCYLTGKV